MITKVTKFMSDGGECFDTLKEAEAEESRATVESMLEARAVGEAKVLREVWEAEATDARIDAKLEELRAGGWTEPATVAARVRAARVRAANAVDWAMEAENEEDVPPLDYTIFGSAENFMIDCETMSTQGDAAVLQVGAVWFDMYGLGDEFEVNISLEDLIKHECDVSATTILWWLGQSTEAQQALIEGQSRAVTIKSAMDSLTDFLMPEPWAEPKVWGNDPSSDNRWVMELCSKVGTPLPWKYYDNRCYRTFCAERKHLGIKRPRATIKHSALADAKAQAMHMVELLNY